jgi:trimeric autotransporter adhesin
MRDTFAGELMRTRRANKALALGVVAVVVTLFGLLVAAKPAHASTFTVNSTSDTDDGSCSAPVFFLDCTLREAINHANDASGQDIIAFNISGTGVKTIEVGKSGNGALPNVTRRVTISGYTQPGAQKNTLKAPRAINASPLIELDGSFAGDSTSGLRFVGSGASNSVVRGLIINDFGLWGILCQATGVKVEGNFIGTDPSGTQAQGNAGGVIGGGSNYIGGTLPEARNLISGNDGLGVRLTGSGNRVQGNLIGKRKQGDIPLGNNAYGVLIDFGGSDNIVGGTASGAANVIAHNGLDGVNVDSGTENRILSNSIYNNGELGIDLVGGIEDPSPVVGITLNDLEDKDSGPNGLQNYPWLSEAKHNLNGTTTIKGTLNSRPEKTYLIQVFSSNVGDPDGFGEGQVFLGQRKVETNKNGNVAFTITTTLPEVDDRISATATGGGGTSEFAHWIDQ